MNGHGSPGPASHLDLTGSERPAEDPVGRELVPMPVDAFEELVAGGVGQGFHVIEGTLDPGGDVRRGDLAREREVRDVRRFPQRLVEQLQRNT